MQFLITGVAGFIGMHTAKRLLAAGHSILGIDNMSNYNDIALKQYRLAQLEPFPNFRFIKMDLADRENVSQLFKKEHFDRVIHLAAQAGTRYSTEAPFDYVDSNLVGMMTVLEGCRHSKIKHLIYASSSSVYGMNEKIPFSETDQVDNPVSLYAATKKANELMAHSYSKLYDIPTTGLRFFTVYGPAGRPDMAPWLFTEAILEGKPIQVFNQGNMMRDFTYIDDVVEGILRIQDVIPNGKVPYALFNIGNNKPVQLAQFIQLIEAACGKKAEKNMLDMQLGDVRQTCADISQLETIIGYRPTTNIDEGIAKFVQWYKEYKNFRHNPTP